MTKQEFDWAAILKADERLEDGHNRIFSEAYFQEIADWMGVDPDPEQCRELQKGHLVAFDRFWHALYTRQTARTLKEENALLERVESEARRLLNSLLTVSHFGEAQPNLIEQISTNPTAYTGPQGQTLSSLLDRQSRVNKLRTLHELLSDLAASANRAQIRTPKPGHYALEIPDNFEEIDLDAIEKAVLSKPLGASNEYDADMQIWSARVAARKQEREHELVAFLRSLKEIWSTLSPHAFTQGKYYERIGHEPARLVQVVRLFLNQLGYPAPTSQIANAIRAANKEA